MAKRRRVRENPLKTRDKALIAGGGVVFLSTILYFVTRPAKTDTSGSKTTTNGKGASPDGKGGSTPNDKGEPNKTPSSFALLAAAIAAIKKADASWAYSQDNLNYQPATTQAQVDRTAAYDAMVAAVLANQIETGVLADAAKAAVTNYQAKLTAYAPETPQAELDVLRDVTFNAMLAAVQATTLFRTAEAAAEEAAANVANLTPEQREHLGLRGLPV